MIHPISLLLGMAAHYPPHWPYSQLSFVHYGMSLLLSFFSRILCCQFTQTPDLNSFYPQLSLCLHLCSALLLLPILLVPGGWCLACPSALCCPPAIPSTVHLYLSNHTPEQPFSFWAFIQTVFPLTKKRNYFRVNSWPCCLGPLWALMLKALSIFEYLLSFHTSFILKLEMASCLWTSLYQ